MFLSNISISFLTINIMVMILLETDIQKSNLILKL